MSDLGGWCAPQCFTPASIKFKREIRVAVAAALMVVFVFVLVPTLESTAMSSVQLHRPIAHNYYAALNSNYTDHRHGLAGLGKLKLRLDAAFARSSGPDSR